MKKHRQRPTAEIFQRKLMKNPKVSIIIPVYNGSNFAAEAIDSALAQTYSNFEVLVINDGSTDNGQTAEIAKGYGSKIRYFEKPNGGVATALNLGIEKMTGDYFSWLSHDDIYLPNKLEAQINFINKENIPGNAILYSDYALIDASGRQFITSHLKNISTGIVGELIANSFLGGCTLLVPKIAFEKAGNFNPDLKTTQDYELWFRFVKAGLVFVKNPGVLIKSRQHPGQDSLVKLKFHKKEEENLYLWTLANLTAEQIFGFHTSYHLNYFKLYSVLEVLGFNKVAHQAKSLGLKSAKKAFLWYLLKYNVFYPTFFIAKGLLASGGRFLARQVQKHKESFLVFWIILWVGLWCFLVGFYGVQKLLPASWGLKPLQNITNEQGQWNWSIN